MSLGQSRAHDFDPYGDDQDEHGDDVGRRPRRRPGHVVDDRALRPAGFGDKPGVGIYIDAKPGVVGKQLDIRTADHRLAGQGLRVELGRPGRRPTCRAGRTSAPTFDADKKKLSIQLDTAGQKFRYYLVWITKLPPSGQASISEIVLFQ